MVYTFYNILSHILALFLCFNFVETKLSAYEDEDDEHCFSRYAFLTTCPKHFFNINGVKHTWMEPESLEVIDSFSKHLHVIPKIYNAECYSCFDCNGVGFCLDRGCDDPIDFDAFEELFKGHVQSKRGYGKYCKYTSDPCECPSWYGGYFRLWNHKYIHFFKCYLNYCFENEKCQCYWPESDFDARSINNSVYRLLKDLADDNLINHELSSHWQANVISFDYYGKVFTDLYHPNSHGMAGSLTTYTFFYSQYHQMLLAVADFIDSNSIQGNTEAINRIYDKLEEIRDDFEDQYNICIRCHPHPKIYYERGMLRLHSGNVNDAFMDVNRLMNMAKTDRYKDEMLLTSEMYQQEGELYADLGRYDKAIASLSEAIRLDPKNRGAYFSRAQAYFETGEFDQSLDDYIKSKDESGLKAKLKYSSIVKESVLSGLQEGCAEAIVDFAPSFCRSVYGLCSSVWVCAQHPIDSTTQFVNACYEIGNSINEFCQNVNLYDLESYPIEIQRIYDQFDRLSETEKGHQIGYIVGRYGVDIFAGGAAIKCVTAFKKLRNANQVCMLEAMTISETNKKMVIASAFKHKTEREAFFKNVKLVWDQQNKHVVGKHNYEPGKSIFDHTNPEGLINKFAGKGIPINKEIPGNPNYRELVDFGEHIGVWKDKKGNLSLPTTKGHIHYSKKGAHIIPAHPESTFGNL